jgi:hypothetical protein
MTSPRNGTLQCRIYVQEVTTPTDAFQSAALSYRIMLWSMGRPRRSGTEQAS